MLKMEIKDRRQMKKMKVHMKKEDGKISTKILIIIIMISIVIISGVGMILLLSTGTIKIGDNELKIGNKNKKNSK